MSLRIELYALYDYLGVHNKVFFIAHKKWISDKRYSVTFHQMILLFVDLSRYFGCHDRPFDHSNRLSMVIFLLRNFPLLHYRKPHNKPK